MANIKSYKDGDRLILVIENCNGELAVKANNFIADILGIVPAEPEPVLDVEPVSVANEAMPKIEECELIVDKKPFSEPSPKEFAYNTFVEGGSGTLGNAIALRDTQAVIGVCASAGTLTTETREPVVEICKEYIYNDCILRNADLEALEDVKVFFDLYEPITKKAVKNILNSTGYANLNDFFELADEFMVRDAYRCILDELLNKTKR